MSSKTINPPTSEDEILPEYDFSKGFRGKYAEAFRSGYKVVVHRSDGTTEERDFVLPPAAVMLDPDVQRYFLDAAAVNRALRGLIELIPK